jgi:hypothetical protein
MDASRAFRPVPDGGFSSAALSAYALRSRKALYPAPLSIFGGASNAFVCSLDSINIALHDVASSMSGFDLFKNGAINTYSFQGICCSQYPQ